MIRQKKNERYRYGNYDRYYCDRNHQRWDDPRIKVLRQEWFRDKRVADIGSNDGTLTILIATELEPRLIVGIEIDRKLVNKAVENVVFIEGVREKITENSDVIAALKEFEEFPMSFRYIKLPNHVEVLKDVMKMSPFVCGGGNFPRNVSFLCGNYLEVHESQSFDTILCLSTIKWVHLNWGDEGVKSLFGKVWQTLSRGGVFIFEPQSWGSYKKVKGKTEVFIENFEKIRLKPEEFNEYLVGLGFVLECCLEPVSSRKTFKRPILVYRKKEVVEC